MAAAPVSATGSAGESRSSAGTTNATSTAPLAARPSSARTPWKRPNRITTTTKAATSHSSGMRRWKSENE